MRFNPIAVIILISSFHCCFGQTDTNLLAVSEWSAPVKDDKGYTLRGRLLVYDDRGPGAANHARIYVELQHPFQGGWDTPIEIYFNPGFSGDLHFELQDAFGHPVPQFPIRIGGPAPFSTWITLPCDSTMRLRGDLYTLGTGQRPSGLVILTGGNCWHIPPNTTNRFFLSGSFTPPKTDSNPNNHHIWQGTLTFPKVYIPVKK